MQESNQPTEPQPHKKDSPKKPFKEGWRGALSTIAVLILAPIVAVLLTTFVFQSYEVDGPSMENTLQDRDRLIVWKVPRTISRISGNDYIPSRGEIIIFSKENSSDFGSTTNRQLIKRVIALPGERVVVRDGHFTVYNDEYPDGFNPDSNGDSGSNAQFTQGTIDIVVPEGEVFVAGDNRANSLDSRAFGTVPADDIVGSLAFRIFPFDKVKAF